jgi:hypothetical protein
MELFLIFVMLYKFASLFFNPRMSPRTSRRVPAVAATQKGGAPARGFTSLIQAKTGSAVNPVQREGCSPCWRKAPLWPQASRSRMFQASSSMTKVKGSKTSLSCKLRSCWVRPSGQPFAHPSLGAFAPRAGRSLPRPFARHYARPHPQSAGSQTCLDRNEPSHSDPMFSAQSIGQVESHVPAQNTSDSDARGVRAPQQPCSAVVPDCGLWRRLAARWGTRTGTVLEPAAGDGLRYLARRMQMVAVCKDLDRQGDSQ